MQLIVNVKSCILCCSIALTALAGHSQSLFKGCLFEKLSHLPVPFATIKILDKPFGTFSNDKGEFEVLTLTSDTLLVTSVGFETLKVAAFSRDTFFLTQVFRKLPLAFVSNSNRITTLTLGIEAKTDFLWGPSGYGEEFAQKVNLNLKDDEIGKLKIVTFRVKRFSLETPVLIHIYTVHPLTGLPLTELLAKNYVIKENNFRNGKVIVDISSENINVDESSVFVSFEWLGYGKNNGIKPKSKTVINMTNRIGESFTYSRTLANTSYDWFPAPKRNGKVTNTIFTIEIDKFK